MTNQEYENQEWLYAWLRHRVKYDQEYLNNIDKYKVSVKNLNFSWQNLEGKFVIENFPKLTSLNLGNNELNEVEIRNCPRLEEIIASHNKLTRLDIKDCEQLKELYTHNNKLTDLNISELKKLKVLSYSENKLLDSKKLELDALGLKEKSTRPAHPIRTLANDEFINNTEITEIDISNEAGWEGLLQVRNCPNLTSLVVDNCQLEKLQIINCPNLELLSFRHNKIKFIGLNQLTKLESLYCSNNKLSSLNVEKNISLKHLVCDYNPINFLEVFHLKELLSLCCFNNELTKLNCNGLNKLEELYCANSKILKSLDTNGCDSLEILDCAENSLENLIVTDKPNLKTISCKENYLEELIIKNCPNLEQLDFCRQDFSETNFSCKSSNSIKKLFYDKKAIVPDWKTFPNLELVRVGEIKKVKFIDERDKKEKEENTYFTEETDFIVIKNTEKVQNILDNPDNYSADDLLKLDKEELYGVPIELREKLIILMIEKHNKEIREQFTDEGYETEEEEKEEELQDKNDNAPLFEEEIPLISEEEPTPELDYKQLYLELLAKIEQGKISIKNKDEIANSPLTEDKKQELYNLLTEKENNSLSENKEQPVNYSFLISLGVVIVIGILIGYLFSKKKKPTPLKH